VLLHSQVEVLYMILIHTAAHSLLTRSEVGSHMSDVTSGTGDISPRSQHLSISPSAQLSIECIVASSTFILLPTAVTHSSVFSTQLLEHVHTSHVHEHVHVSCALARPVSRHQHHPSDPSPHHLPEFDHILLAPRSSSVQFRSKTLNLVLAAALVRSALALGIGSAHA